MLYRLLEHLSFGFVQVVAMVWLNGIRNALKQHVVYAV